LIYLFVKEERKAEPENTRFSKQQWRIF